MRTLYILGVSWCLVHTSLSMQKEYQRDKQVGLVNTELHEAVFHNDMHRAGALLKAGADIDCLDTGGAAPLHYAIMRQQVAMVQLLLDHGANIHKPKIYRTEGHLYDKVFPLHLAVLAGNRQLVHKLIKKGALVDVGDHKGLTPLHYAARQNKYMVAFMLVHTYDADGLIIDYHQLTAYDWAYMAGNTRIQELLLHKPYRRGLTLMHAAAIDNYWTNLGVYATQGANIHAVDEKKATPLHHAAANGSLECLHRLLVWGANCEARDSSHLTPLFYALQYDQCYAIQVLIDHKANIEALLPVTGARPAHYVAHLGYHRSLKVLLAAGAQVNAQDYDGNTPLHNAVRQKHILAVELLCTYNANPLLRNNAGETSWDIAIKKADVACAFVLNLHMQKYNDMLN